MRMKICEADPRKSCGRSKAVKIKHLEYYVLIPHWCNMLAFRSLLLFLIAALASGAVPAAETLTLGVFAYRPKPIMEAQYQPLVDYLNTNLGDTRIQLQALELDEIEERLANDELDLVITNPGHYVLLHHRYKFTGAFATVVKNSLDGQVTQYLGGVVITRRDRNDINQLTDLKGQQIAICGYHCLGGYLTQAYELRQAGIDLSDNTQLIELGQHDAVVNAVLDRSADVGFIRTEILEDLSQNGKLDLKQLKVINRQNWPDFPFITSTSLYPEWPIIALPWVDQSIVRRIASLLLAMEYNHPAAKKANIAGFAPPSDYRAVENLARELRLPPYDHVSNFTWVDIWNQHKLGIFISSLLLAIVGLLFWITVHRNQSLHRQQRLTAKYSHRLQDIIHATQVGTWEWNIQTGETVFNERWAEIIGYTLAELLPTSIQTWIDLTHPDDLKAALEILQRHFEGETDYYQCNFRMKHKSGHWIWVHDLGQVTEWSADGNPLLMYGTHTDITASKKAEQTLKESEERFSLAMSVANDGIWDWSLDTNKVYFDTRYYTMAGYDPHEFPGALDEWEKRVHPDDLKRTMEAIELYLAGENGKFDVEFRFLRKEGDYMWVRARGKIVSQDKDGKPLRFMGTHDDINKEKLIEQALHEGQKKYRDLVNDIGKGFVLYSYKAQSGEVTVVSDGVDEVFGLSKDKVLGKSWVDVAKWNPEDIELANFHQAQFVDNKSEHAKFNMHFIHPDGNERIIRVSAHPVRDKAKNTLAIDGIVEDITKQMAAEEKMRLSASVFEHSQECIIITNADDCIIDVTPSCTKLTGYLREELIGAHTRIFNSDFHDSKFYQEVSKTIRSGEVWRGKFRNRHKDGSQYWAESSISPVKGFTGKITHYVVIKRDITQKEKYLSELRHAKKEALVATRAKSDFLANISHEIRTPMNAILGFAELSMHNDLAPKYQSYIKNIQKSAGMMLILINDILDFSKIEAGKLQLESIPFDLNEELMFVSLMMQSAAERTQVELQFSYDYDSQLSLLGDPLRLKQVLINLISNAIKFTRQGSVRLSVNQLVHTETEVRLKVEVCDTGIGISREEQKNLFHMFSQADTSTSRVYGGTGLGLAISRELVSKMGGTLKYESKKGIGSTFFFEIVFPIASYTKEPVQKKQKTFDRLAKARILVVEDDECNQTVIAGLLERYNLSVEIACSGQEAVDKLTVNKYDMVLMDIQMPLMDGYEASRKIRRVHQHDELPIIALTANAQLGVREKCFLVGMNDYITKPIDSQILLNKIERLLEGKKLTRSSQSTIALVNNSNIFTLLLDLPGIDAKQAINRLDIEPLDYAALLTKFSLNHRDDITEIIKEIKKGGWDIACRTVHTLKGVASTIGAETLSRLLWQLEQELQQQAASSGTDDNQKSDDLSALLVDTDKELANIVTGIDKLQIEKKSPPQIQEIGATAVVQWLKDLLELSERHNVSAISQIEALLVVADASIEDALCGIQQDLKDYDFESAAKSLKALLASME